MVVASGALLFFILSDITYIGQYITILLTSEIVIYPKTVIHVSISKTPHRILMRIEVPALHN